MNYTMVILDSDNRTPKHVSFEEYAEWMDAYFRHVESGGDDFRQVAYDELAGGVRVSTVFLLGSYCIPDFDNRPPFETMVFGGEYDLWQQRWWTWEQAEVEHLQVILNLNNGLHPEGLQPE